MCIQEVHISIVLQYKTEYRRNTISYPIGILLHRIIYQELKETESFQAINDCVIMYLIGPTFSFELTVSLQHYQLWRGVCQLETERRHRWRWPALSFFSFFFMPLFLPLLPTFFISGCDGVIVSDVSCIMIFSLGTPRSACPTTRGRSRRAGPSARE